VRCREFAGKTVVRLQASGYTDYPKTEH